MVSFRSATKWLLAVAPFAQYVSAQASAPTSYEDPDTGIVFDTWTASGMTFGFTFPEDGRTDGADEFIGYLSCEGSGWCGLSLGGPMTSALLVMAYPHDDEIYTAFKWATGYDMPVPYEGDAKITQISSNIEADKYTLIYRCEGCTSWSQDGVGRSMNLAGGNTPLGWCHGAQSPTSAECPNDAVVVQHERQSIFGAAISDSAFNTNYDDWAELATNVVEGDCDGDGGDDDPTTTTSLPPATGTPVPEGVEYDYIVVGGGAGGIPVADRLSEAGHKVLMIEKGPPSSGRWGGKRKPEWLEGTNLTRFDVPGLCNQIWADSSGIACQDTDQMAGCVLGGGTAVNAGLWWKPNPDDWDYNFPDGWKAKDMQGATDKVFKRIPGTLRPSVDGKLYRDEGYEVISGGLAESGWKSVDALKEPGAKNHTFTHTPYMFANGERGGAMATYLVSADARDNFDWWSGTAVRRVVRSGGHVTGVEVEAYLDGGFVGTVKLKPQTGRVILSAGTFGSAKILLRSGIGPEDQLEVVANSTRDGSSMIGEDEWIQLPVGHNLEDHTNTDTVVTHPDVVFYDFYEAFDNPPEEDEELYLGKRSGILAQSAPNIGPVFFDEIKGKDGIVRQMQWTARVEPSLGETSNKSITMSQYLGRGAKSRGRMTITSALNTQVSDNPYLKDKEDVEAVIKGIENLQAALKNVKGLEWKQPAPGVSARDYVNDMLVSWTNRRANHWIGTNKMGKDDGRAGGTAVVDRDTRVFGTDNLFVVDASIFPGMVTTNPTSYIMTVAEKAAENILKLSAFKQVGQYEQCGGLEWTGSFQCGKGFTCKKLNTYYHQCYPESK